MVTMAHRVTDFLAGLHAMDLPQSPLENPKHAAIRGAGSSRVEFGAEDQRFDAQVRRASPDAARAQAMATLGPVADDTQAHYEHIRDYFAQKTGFSG